MASRQLSAHQNVDILEVLEKDNCKKYLSMEAIEEMANTNTLLNRMLFPLCDNPYIVDMVEYANMHYRSSDLSPYKYIHNTSIMAPLYNIFIGREPNPVEMNALSKNMLVFTLNEDTLDSIDTDIPTDRHLIFVALGIVLHLIENGYTHEKMSTRDIINNYLNKLGQYCITDTILEYHGYDPRAASEQGIRLVDPDQLARAAGAST
jgi:hypothetical protein